MGAPGGKQGQHTVANGQPDRETPPADKVRPKPGALRLQAVLKNGRPTPEVVVEILEKYPAEQSDLLEAVNKDPRLGMSFTHKVIAIMTMPRGQRPLPLAETQSDKEIPVEPDGYYSPAKRREMTLDGDVVKEKSRHEKTENKGDKGVLVSPSNPRWKTIATQVKSIVETDDAGDTLVINSEYKLEERPGETEVTQTHIETNRNLVLTLANGEKIYAHLHGEAIALIEANAKLDPEREVHQHSIGPHNTGNVYLPATEESPPTIFGEDGDTLARATSGEGLLDYDNPLKQLAALKSMMKHRGMVSGGAAMGQAHGQAKELRREEAGIADSLRKHIAHVKNYEDGDPVALARAEDYLRDLGETLHTIGSNRADGGPDAKDLQRIRLEMFTLLQEAREARATPKGVGGHAMDLMGAPIRLAERIGGGALEYGKTMVDFTALGIDALGKWTGIGTFEWDPISAVGKAAQHGATSSDVLKGVVFGIVDEWSSAIEHARHGDFSKILDAGVDSILLAQSAADIAEYAAVKTPQLASKLSRLAKTAGEIVASAKAPTEVIDRLSAIAETIKVWVDESQPAPAMQMGAHGGSGGPPGGGISFGDAKKAGQLKKLEATRERTIKVLGEQAKDAKLSEFAAHVEQQVFVGDVPRATKFFKALGENPGITNDYFRIVGEIAKDPVIGTSDMASLLESSVHHANATEFVVGVQKILAKNLDRPTTLKLLDRASRGQVDLDWLASTHATAAELKTLATDGNTPFNKLKDAAKNYNEGKPVNPGDERAIDGNIRGAAAELVAEESLPSGFKLAGKSAGHGADFPLVDSQGNPAALEVKGGNGNSWTHELDEVDQGRVSDKWKRMVRQLNDSLAKGQRTFLGISDDITGDDLLRLSDYFLKHNMKVEIHLMDESSIQRVELVLRAHLGLPS